MGSDRLLTPRLYFDRDMDQAETHPIADGIAGVFSGRCPDKETPNEDAAAIIPVNGQAGVLAVADGLGGVAVGEEAASLAVKALVSEVKKSFADRGMLRTAIMNGFETANQSVRDLGVGTATTLAVAEVNDGAVRPYHVGDSIIIVVGQRGKIKLQTVSHSPVGYAVEAGVLSEVEAMHHEDRHLVSNVIGMPEMRIEVGPTVHLAPRDTLLLASDGLFDNLHLDEIVASLRKGMLVDVMQRLVNNARQRMSRPTAEQPSKPDDLTFVVYRRARAT